MTPTKYAHTRNKHVVAMRKGLLRFPSRSQAESRLKKFREIFIVSKVQDEDGRSLRFWIKGFEVTKEETAKGFIGNFGEVTVAELGNGEGFTLNLRKVPADSGHPMKKTGKKGKHPHPNWSHPVMREVKKKTAFPSWDDARARLQALYDDYPDAIIPKPPDGLFVQMWDRSRNPPIRRCILSVQETESGFVLDIRDNRHQGRAPRKKVDEVIDSRFIIESGVPAIKVT